MEQHVCPLSHKILNLSLRLSFASFLWSPSRSKKKKRSHTIFEVAWLIMLGLFSSFDYPFFGVGIKSSIDLFIGQRAVYPSAHHHSTIFKDFTVRLPLGLWLLPQTHLQKRIGCVLCKLSFPYLQNLAMNNLCSIDSSFDNLR